MLIGLLGALFLTGAAQAYTCPETPIDERIAAAEAVFVGRSTGFTPVRGDGIPQRLYRFKVDQEVKGDVGRTVDVRIPVKRANGGQVVALDVAAGILMNRVDGGWFTTRCGITDPGVVLAEVDQQKGNPIRLAIGILILIAVLTYSIRRVRRRDPQATSPAMTIQRVLVVGAGQMGAGIAQVVAASGRDVVLHDPFPGAVERGIDGMRRSLEKLEAKGGAPAADVLGRVSESSDLVAADLMIEAIVEDRAAKEDLFRAADAVLPEGAILASNTSSIPITSLAAVTTRPERVIGMHFFNPVPMLQLVEVIRGLQTSDETAAEIVALARDLGKVPAEAHDFPGFVSNRILMPFINEAAYALMEGVAEAEAIDTIAKLGFAHPLGPLALADLIGLDTCVAIMEVLHEGLGNPKYAPCPLLRQYVAAGRLGRKSGRGFYDYA